MKPKLVRKQKSGTPFSVKVARFEQILAELKSSAKALDETVKNGTESCHSLEETVHEISEELTDGGRGDHQS